MMSDFEHLLGKRADLPGRGISVSFEASGGATKVMLKLGMEFSYTDTSFHSLFMDQSHYLTIDQARQLARMLTGEGDFQ